MHLRSNPGSIGYRETANGSYTTAENSREATPSDSEISQDPFVVSIESNDADDGRSPCNLEDSVRTLLADLNLSPGWNQGLKTPSTASDLYNATPRPSSSPEPPPCSREIPPIAFLEDHEDQAEDDLINGVNGLDIADRLRPYDIEKEALPSDPFFAKGFQTTLKSGKHLARAIHADLVQPHFSGSTISELGRLQETAERLASFESPAVRLVGIVGDSAAGKSSLINSLLNMPDLAHKGDHGSAVTSFVTEYRRRSLHHTAPFTIEAEYCNPEEINDQLHELLVSYRELYQPGLAKELENNQEMYHEIERKSEAAFSTLQSIFPDHPDMTDTYLRGSTDGAFDRIFGELRTLAKAIEWPEGAANGKWVASASNSADCHEKVAYFMQKGLWPLTNIVRIYLSAQILKSGVVLADLPGYRDINLARVKKAEQYLLRCHEIFIVANINRVASDQSVARFVKDQMKASGKRASVTIVCTHADDIDLASAKKQYKRVGLTREGTKYWETKMHEFKHGSPASSQLADLRYKYLYITARNAEIKHAVRKRYADPDADVTVNVFCVGNRDYEGQEYRSQEARDEAAHGSCIPELRRFCHSVVARAQLEASTHYLKVELPSLVQSLKVWLSAAQQEPLKKIDPQIILDLQSDVVREIQNFAEAMEETLSDHVLDSMVLHDREFNAHAIEASEEWTEWAWNSYKAFCRNNGTYHTAAVGSRSWNAELLGAMNETMSLHWRSLEQGLVALRNDLQRRVSNDCKETRTQLQSLSLTCLQAQWSETADVEQALDLPDALLGAFKLRELQYKYLLRNKCSDISDEIRIIEYNATSDHLSSFIVEIMLPTYRASARESGPGTLARMHKIMKTRLARRDIFRLIHTRIEDETKELFMESMGSMSDHIMEMCGSIRRDLEVLDGSQTEAQHATTEQVEAIRILVDSSNERLAKLQEDLWTS